MADRSARPDGLDCGSRWTVIASSARGAHHRRQEVDSQDSWHQATGSGGALSVAVADGHGHRRHFRSGRGAALATGIACAEASVWSGGLDPTTATVPELKAAIGSELLPRIWQAWCGAVIGDVGNEPFTAEEQSERRPGDTPVVAYGSTLLLAVTLGRWVLLAQIGDGDMLVAAPDGRVTVPLPPDGDLAADRTSSLSQPDALGAFRVAVIDSEVTPTAVLLLATDGYGNAQIDDPWQPGVGADLVSMLDLRGPAWVADMLPSWAERCASVDGSGDDTTVALLVGGP